MLSMSKKIDAAVKAVIKALEKHAEAVDRSPVSLKKSQRAGAKLQAAATAYAEAVYVKSGLDSPFSDVLRPGLHDSTLESLEAERDALSRQLSELNPQQKI